MEVEKVTKLKNFILKQIIRDPSFVLDETTLLVTSGLIDSLSILDLGMFIEDLFKVEIPDYALTAANLDTISQILEFVSLLEKK